MAEAANGSVQPSGKGNGVSRRVGRESRGFVTWLVSLVARLVTWAAILTILFRCPATLEECDNNSPFVCVRYFRVKEAISPHAKPYYDKYAAPYVGAAQPYYNHVRTRVVMPVRDYAVLYGEPWVIKGRDFVVTQWESNGHPRLAQLQSAAWARYDESVAPHVSKVVTLAEPYYTVARAQTIHAVDNVVYPAYELAKPYAIQGYHASRLFTVTTLLPAVQWSWATTNAFLERVVWPQLRVVYAENVEPQLVRIGERLGRYKSHAKSRVLPGSTSIKTWTSSHSTIGSSSPTSLVSKPPSQGESPSVVGEASGQPASAAKSQVDPQSLHDHVEAATSGEAEDDGQKVREMVASDLQSWQEKFASQAEQGATEIENSVNKISRVMMNEEGNVAGAQLISQLEQTIRTALDELKQRINLLVAQNLEGVDIDTQKETVVAVRSAGIAIKTKAQVIRDWRHMYDENLESSILASSEKHFAILDETRSLALQHIGMKWAWTDGVTYQDWARYHELKTTLSDWTEDLKHLVVTNPALLEAQDVAAQVEDRGMSIAASAAKELASLKEVVQWKIKAEDTTDSFDVDKLKLIVEERAKAAEEARLKAEEEEARIKAEEEAQAIAEMGARIKAQEEAAASEADTESWQEEGETQGEGSEGDPRIRSVEEASESKPLISEDVTATDESMEKSTTDIRMRSVEEASESKPLISEDVTAIDESMEKSTTDIRMRSVEEASESKPLISEDVTATNEPTEMSSTDVRIQSVKESFESKPLVSDVSTVSDSDSGVTGAEETERLVSTEAVPVPTEGVVAAEHLGDDDIPEVDESIMKPRAAKKSRNAMEATASFPVESSGRADR